MDLACRSIWAVMSLTLSGLLGDVRDLIGSGAYDRLFSHAMATKGMNFACTQCAEIMDLTRVDTRLPVTANQAVQPADAVKLVTVQTWWITSGGRPMGKNLIESTLETEDQKNPNWRSRAGEPTVWIPYSGNTILLNGQPAPATSRSATSRSRCDGQPDRLSGFPDQGLLAPVFPLRRGSWLTETGGPGPGPEEVEGILRRFRRRDQEYRRPGG